MSVIATLSGAVVGALLTAGLWLGRYLLIERRKKKRLEKIVHTELSHMHGLDILEEIPENKIPDPSSFPTIFFESNAGKIGMLDQSHRHSIHAFYSLLEVTKEMIKQEIEADEENQQRRKTIRHNLESLQKRRDTLLDSLEE